MENSLSGSVVQNTPSGENHTQIQPAEPILSKAAQRVLARRAGVLKQKATLRLRLIEQEKSKNLHSQ